MCVCVYRERQPERGEEKKKEKERPAGWWGVGGRYEREREPASHLDASHPELATSATVGIVVSRLSHSHSGMTSSSCAADCLAVPFSYSFLYFSSIFTFPLDRNRN